MLLYSFLCGSTGPLRLQESNGPATGRQIGKKSLHPVHTNFRANYARILTIFSRGRGAGAAPPLFVFDSATGAENVQRYLLVTVALFYWACIQ